MRLLIVSAAPHCEFNGHLYGYTPYVREIDIWADLFDKVLIAAPCRIAKPPGDYTEFTSKNISVLPQKEVGGETFAAKLGIIVSLPELFWTLCRAMRQADAIHVRCPGNLGLLGAILAPLFSRNLVAKYAGQWNSNNDGWSLRVQKAILRSAWWGSPVAVYGHWPNQPKHVVPFFTSALTENQLEQARTAIRARKTSAAIRVIYVGRLSRSKNVHVLIEALSKLKAEGIKFECKIVGDGPERSLLESLSQQLNLSDLIEFTAGLSFEAVLECLERSDVLVLASETEGWPKAIAEGMAFGLICIGSNRGIVPQMLGEGRGLLVSPGDGTALLHSLRAIAVAPRVYDGMRALCAVWGQQYSLNSFRTALRDLLLEHWTGQVEEKSGRLQVVGAQS